MTLQTIWQRLIRQKMLFAIVILLALLLAGLLTWMMTPAYRAVSTIQIEKQGAQIVNFGELNKPTPDLGELDPFFRTRYEQLKSRELIAGVIEKLELEQRLFSKDFRTPLRKAFDQRFETMFGPFVSWLKSLLPQRLSSADKKPKADRVTEFLENLYVEPVEKAHLVNVFFVSPDAELSAEVVNTLVDEFISTSVSGSSQGDSYAQTFLERELEKARTRLTNSEEELVSYARENEILEVNNSQVTQEQKLTELNKALVQAEQRRTEAESQLAQARSHGDVSSILSNPTLAALKQQLASLEATYRKQLETFKPAYPDMQQLAGEIRSLQSKINSETARLKRSVEADYAASAGLESRIRSELDSYKNELIELRDRSVEYKALQREVETNRRLFDDLMKRMSEVGVAAGAVSSDVRIVDKATPPARAFRPNKLLNLLLGSLLGVILASGLALLRESWRRSVESASELQAISGLPVLGTIPYVAKSHRRVLPLAAVWEVGSAVAESYRIAAANLKFAGHDGLPRTLTMTSINPAEGKSTSSVNLAVSLAQLGHKVLLIDADLRRPTLHQKAGLNNHAGLTEYLRGEVELSRATQHLGEINNAYVITAGMLNLDPVEALSSQQMKKLISMSQQYFDITLIDGPPLTGFADSLLLASLVDATLLVSSEDNNIDRDHLKDVLAQLQRVKHNVIGFLIVKARNGVVPEQYYARYSKSRRQELSASVITPAMLQKKGLNLAKKSPSKSSSARLRQKNKTEAPAPLIQ
ncbi:MAG: polysaccharide biosynthesis tyrosine autokinase [Thiolinea sp.]